MKTSSFLFGFFVVLTLFILLPLCFIYTNDLLGYPIISNMLMKILGISLILGGILLIIYCSKLFVIVGKGTPVPIEPPKKLVIKGIYVYTRNPIYLSYWTIIFGEFLFFGRPLLLAYLIFFIIVNHSYVLLEEKQLRKRFGESYKKYQEDVPRYVPKLFSSSS